MTNTKPVHTAGQPSLSRRIALPVLIAVIGLVIGIAGFEGAGNGWSDQIYPNNTTMFTGLSFSGSQIWAFGSHSTVPAPGSSVAQVYASAAYWDGSSWHATHPAPAGVMSQLISGTSGANGAVWAVGATQNSSQYSDSIPWQPLITRWNGSTWKNMTPSGLPSGGNFFSVSAPSASDVWTVGFVSSKKNPPYQTVAYHYDGAKWHALPSPGTGTGLQSVIALSRTNVWAAGWIGSKGLPDILHWTGSSWNTVPIAGIPSGARTNVNIMRLSFDSPTDGWAVGTYPNPQLSGHTKATQASIPLVAHWNGTRWQTLPTKGFPTSLLISVQDVHAFSASNVWVCGGYSNTIGNPNAFQPFLAHWNGSTWSVNSHINFSTFNGGMANALAGSSSGTIAVLGLDSAGSSLLIGSSAPLAASTITQGFAGLPNGFISLLLEIVGLAILVLSAYLGFRARSTS